MVTYARGLNIKRDTANVEPYIQMGDIDIVTLELAGTTTITTNATSNATAFATLTVPLGAVSVAMTLVCLFGVWKYSFTSSGGSNVWERVLPLNSTTENPASRNIQLDVRKTATTLQFRVSNIVAGTVTTDVQYHIRATGFGLTAAIGSTTASLITAPTTIAPTANISMLQDRTNLVHNEITQAQTANHYGGQNIGQVRRRLNAASFSSASGATNTNTAIHIVLEVPQTGFSSHIVKIDGSIIGNGVLYHVPLTSTCHAYLGSATTISKQNFQQFSGDYVWTFYFGTTGSYAGKLILKLTRIVTANTLPSTAFVLDTLSGGVQTGDAMKVTSIVENTGANL